MSKFKIILLVFIILAISSLSIIGVEAFKKETPQQVTSVTSQELSLNEYTKIRDELITTLSKQDPRVALRTLREKAKEENAVARSCHGLVHELGHAAYEKYEDFGQAMQYQDDMCNSGYLHGIIESHFTKSQDIFATMQTVCSDYSPTQFIGWECYHGVGHGLMYYTTNDLPKSLTYCESYDEISKRMACVNGVFMENFNVDQKLHISKYVKAQEPFYPCTEQKYEYKADCYLYAPTYFLSLNKNKYVEALTLCKTAEKEFQLTCISGVGSQTIKENINNPTSVESICIQAGSLEEQNACITGMVGLYINHFGGLDEAKQLCNKLKKPNQLVCKQTITSYSVLFQN